MNKIDKRFFYYKTRAAYEEDKDRIPMEAVVFIKDPLCILTHGVEYKYEKLEAGEGIQINGNIISSNLDLNNLSEDLIELIVQLITLIMTTNDSPNGVYTKEYIDNLTEELRSEISDSCANLDTMEPEQKEAFIESVAALVASIPGSGSTDNTYTQEQINGLLNTKQNKLNAGTGINIDENTNTISANALSESDKELIIQQVVNAVGASTGDLTIDVNDKILRIYKQNNN